MCVNGSERESMTMMRSVTSNQFAYSLTMTSVIAHCFMLALTCIVQKVKAEYILIHNQTHISTTQMLRINRDVFELIRESTVNFRMNTLLTEQLVQYN